MLTCYTFHGNTNGIIRPFYVIIQNFMYEKGEQNRLTEKDSTHQHAKSTRLRPEVGCLTEYSRGFDMK